MREGRNSMTRRAIGATLLTFVALAAGIVVAQAPRPTARQSPQRPVRPLLMDGHTHITNRVHWEGIDPWTRQSVGTFDYARAWEGGVNVVFENVSPYGYDDYNGVVKETGRLIETFHRVLEQHRDRMELALTSADVRRIVASGKMAVLLGIESGFDQDGDIDILRLWYRLGVRSIQFTSHGGTAFADAAFPGAQHWNGINDRGRQLIAEMNRLGMLIDISHATDDAMRQIVQASRSPVVGSHVGIKEIVNRPGSVPADVVRAVAAGNGLLALSSNSVTISQRYLEWSATHRSPAVPGGITPGDDWTMERKKAPDFGEYSNAFDSYMSRRWHMMWAQPWRDLPDAPVPTVDDYADYIARAVAIAGPEHIAIGQDLWHGRSHIKDFDASQYQRLVEALRRRNVPAGVLGENWLRVLDAVQGVRAAPGKATAQR
jgi:membrane dipeptidase